MKKILLTLCLILTTQIGFAQSAKDIINEFKDAPKAEYQHVPKILLKFIASSAKASADDEDDRAQARVLKRISSITALNLEDCSSSVKERYAKAVKNMSTNGYEELLRAKEDGETTLILMKSKGDAVTELLIVDSSSTDPALVQIKGKIAKSDIEVVIGMNE